MDFSLLHSPVLCQEIKNIFSQKKFLSPVVVDATLGLGGHASMFLENMNDGVFVGFDRDQDNFVLARERLSAINTKAKIELIPESFASLDESLDSRDIDAVDFFLYDLGVSSLHYDDPSRGFSIRDDGPLDMRFDRKHGKNAEDIVMNASKEELSRIFEMYGEEIKSWFIASAIVEARKNGAINTTQKLLEIIRKSSFDPKSPIRVFQALRIAVNDEFGHIETSLESALKYLRVGGCIAVITFHSLEDRLVKQFFAPYLEDVIDDYSGQIRERAHFKKYTKKPIEPTLEEVSLNPRSRSAKLRIIERVY